MISNYGSTLSNLWNLSPEVIYLNHGSFGATPRVVSEYQSNIKQKLEQQPMRFFLREADELLYNSKKILADFVGADVENMVFVPNVSNGVNVILHSLNLKSDDHILITNHIYFYCKNALNFITQNTGAKIDIVNIDFPIKSSDDIIEKILAKVTPNTRIALLDHVSSATGLVFPIAEIVKQLNTKNVDVIVDGAHSPGMIPVNINNIGAAYYVGNCHKWICAPKSAGFIHVRTDKIKEINPAIICRLPDKTLSDMSDFQYMFSWAGTSDVSAYISVGKTINYMGSIIEGGWAQIMKTNRQLALKGQQILCNALEIDIPVPEDMIGSLASIPLPDDNTNFDFKSVFVEPVYKKLSEEHNIEVLTSIFPAYPKKLIRISAQLYNTEKQIEVLAETLKEILLTK